MARLFRNPRIFAGGFLAFCFAGGLSSSFSTLLGLIKEDFGLTYTLSGALMSAYFVGYTIGQIPWGYLADKVGGRMVITLSVVGIAVSTLLFGLSVDVWQAIVLRFFAGFLGAGIFVPTVRLVSSWFSSGERGTGLGLISIGRNVGQIVFSWVTPLLAIGLGWRGPIVILGFLGILTSGVVWLTLSNQKNPPSTTPLNPPKTSAFLKSRSFWVLALLQFLRLGAYYVFIGWLPLILQEEYSFSLIWAGIALSVFNFAGMLSNPLGGFVADRFGGKAALLISFSLLACDVFLFTVIKVFPLVMAAVCILGWFINFVRSPSFAILPRLYGVDVAGRISGVHNTFASFGALVLPFCLGFIRDVTESYQIGWMVLSGLLAVGTIVTLFLRVSNQGQNEQ